MGYLKNWEDTVAKRQGFAKMQQKMMLIPIETRQGIEVTGEFISHIRNCLLYISVLFLLMKSFVEIVQYLFGVPGVTKFSSGWLSQDSLEKFFGCQQQQGKSSENPNCYEFCKNTQALGVINSACGNVPRGNCRGSKYTIDWEAESKPLPKRRKTRSANKEIIINCPTKRDHPTKSNRPSASDHSTKNITSDHPTKDTISDYLTK